LLYGHTNENEEEREKSKLEIFLINVVIVQGKQHENALAIVHI
jgi:hypothetical protein